MVMRENRACWLASNTLPIPIFTNVIEVRNLNLNSPVGEFDFQGLSLIVNLQGPAQHLPIGLGQGPSTPVFY